MNESRRQILLDTPHTETATGAIASFETDMVGRAKEVKVEIEPVQDLHGYDNPWPAGGGKNKVKMTLDDMKTANTAGTWSNNVYTRKGLTFTVNVDAAGNITGVIVNGTATGGVSFIVSSNLLDAGSYIMNGCPSGGTSSSYFIYCRKDGNVSSAARDYGSGVNLAVSNSLDNVTVYIASGYTASNLVFKPMIRLATETDATFAPYSNICPISGWTGANVEARGKNLWDGTFVNMAIATFTGGVKVVANSSYRGFYVRAVGGNSYTISRTIIETNRFRIGATVEEPADNLPVIWLAQLPSHDSEYSVTVTLPEGYNYIFVYLSNQSDTCTSNNYQVELGSTATAYEPYQGSTTPVSWADEAGTVYGGTLEWEKDGTVTLTKTMASVDLGTLDWTNGSQMKMFFSIGIRELVSKPADNSIVANIISSAFTPISYNGLQTSTVGRICISASGSVGIVDGNKYASVNDLKTAVSGVQLVYELATPVTYTLTPQEALVFLRGTNHVWNDINDTSVTYWTHKTGDSV